VIFILEQTAQQELIRDRSIRLFSYLKELTLLRTPVIYDVRFYEKVFWFHEIPEEPECLLSLYGKEYGRDDTWLEIRKPNIPELPRLPKEMGDWVIPHELKKPSGEVPDLKAQLPNPEYRNDTKLEDEEEDHEEVHEEIENIPPFIYFNDQIELQNIWADYLEQVWKPWFTEYNRSQKVQEQYEKLFSIYQLQKKLGEQYELVVASGFLRWKVPNVNSITRHLLTGRAELTMDTNTGTFTLRASSEGTKPFLEQDMLEVDQRPNRDALQSIESSLEGLEDDFWNEEQMGYILRTWVNSVSAEGNFENTLEVSYDPKPNPVVSFSPALILRKRTERGYIQAYSTIIEQLKQKDNLVPKGIHRVVETLNEDYRDTYVDQEDPSHIPNAADYEVQEIYFPKPANEAQRKIVETLNRQDGVIVQGPPGTGKSHTIANLISHLLASGQKILVTSQTPRALKVLKEKLPSEIQALCVNLLGSDDGSFQDLEKVVQGMTYRRDLWNSSESRLRIKEFETELFELRKKKAGTEQILRSVREQETYTHYLLNGEYQGTASKLANRIRSEQRSYGWVKDQVALEDTMPLTNEEAMEFNSLLHVMTNEMIQELGQSFPKQSDLLEVDLFHNLVEEEERLNSDLGKYADAHGSELHLSFSVLDEEIITGFKVSLEKIKHIYSVLLASGEEWIEKTIIDIHCNQDVTWRELLQVITGQTERLLEDARRYDVLDVQIPDTVSVRQLLQDSKVLRGHLQTGGSLRFPLLLKKNIRDVLYITKSVVLNGQLCSNIDELQTVIQYLEFVLRLDKISDLMKPYMNLSNRSGSYSIYTAQLLRNVEMLEQCIQYSDQLRELHELLKSSGISYSIHQSNQFDELAFVVDSCLILGRKKKLVREFDSLRFMVTQPDQLKQEGESIHPICEDFIQAIESRDVKKYEFLLAELHSLHQQSLKYARFEELQERFKRLTLTYQDLVESQHNGAWSELLNKLEQAFKWAQANTWLKEYLSHSEEDLNQVLAGLDKRIQEILGDIGALKAWECCFKRLTASEQQHLVAWSLAIRNVGKDTGKHAEKHKRDAKYHMEHCRSAIPAWIMPLYRVVESFDPSQGLFDVVIIDEASQSGPEAVLLKYITKKVIVVGDDKQISPEHVGISREHVDQLRRLHLYDFPHGELLGLDNSFFDLANVLFGGRVVLREHFRCMPEIIQFSNQLCYSNTPLIPLRQYPPNRLEPVKSVYVTDGFRQGTGQKVQNRPEAMVIVDTIKQCMSDSRYDGLSMGVITLLGGSQHQLIESLLLREIGPAEMERRNLVCGDAYAFQGDERDVIFLSLVASPGETTMRALAGEKDKRRFNVAASRSRNQLWLFHSATLNDIRNQSCLRYQLISYCQNPTMQEFEGSRDKCESEFEKHVYDRIIERGYRVITQYEFGGCRIDIVIQGMNGQLAVECDGDFWHGPEQYENDMARQRVLERCGWRFWRIRGSEFYYDPEEAMQSLWNLLELYKISPNEIKMMTNNELILQQELKDPVALKKKTNILTQKKKMKDSEEQMDISSYVGIEDGQQEFDF
jgi:very-short-patch-repair endonuclease